MERIPEPKPGAMFEIALEMTAHTFPEAYMERGGKANVRLQPKGRCAGSSNDLFLTANVHKYFPKGFAVKNL